MKTIRHRSPHVVIGSDDPALTPAAGLLLVAEVDRILGVAATLDDWVGGVKARNRGLSAGQLVVSMAECMLAGGDFMCDLDVLRADQAGAGLRAVPEAPASTTFISLARRFDDARIADLESGVGALTAAWFAALPDARRAALAEPRPTLDLDPTDIEVYGSKKQAVAWNYAGQRCGRAHPVAWAEAGVVLAAKLGSGIDDPRPQAPALIATAIAALPEGLGRPRVRGRCGVLRPQGGRGGPGQRGRFCHRRQAQQGGVALGRQAGRGRLVPGGRHGRGRSGGVRLPPGGLA